MFNCKRRGSCAAIAIVSILVGVALGITAFSVAIPNIINALWIAFGIGSFGVIFTTFLSLFSREKECLCENGICLIIFSIGTVIASTIALALTIVTASVPIAILLGVGTFFLVGAILSILKILLCLVEASCRCKMRME